MGLFKMLSVTRKDNPDTKVSLIWDEVINSLIDNGDIIINDDGHTAEIGPYTVWIENYPHSFGYLYPSAIKVIPTMETRLKLSIAIQKEIERKILRMKENDPENQ